MPLHEQSERTKWAVVHKPLEKGVEREVGSTFATGTRPSKPKKRGRQTRTLRNLSEAFWAKSFASVIRAMDDVVFDSPKIQGSFQKSAASIGVATVSSKILGLIREITLASVFGMGPVVTAFKHASVLPGFCMSVLGGW
ncbi:hypothetical protein IFM89_003090 [Coptis chinensis]|uniref:Uncharacterized protein n=1 Tax=Coptis chinensis TaxID=261450 RepID=A0A835I9V8_9MAGN|nr:hypothetical protein IFM89_003090 [Coptis chinensis]